MPNKVKEKNLAERALLLLGESLRCMHDSTRAETNKDVIICYSAYAEGIRLINEAARLIDAQSQKLEKIKALAETESNKDGYYHWVSASKILEIIKK